MRCQSCGKKEATVKYSENINGEKQELHFCFDCAKKLGFVDFSNIFSPVFFNFSNKELKENLKCKICGNTYDDYANTGLFGCANCYSVFEDKLDELFLKLHGNNRHFELLEPKKYNLNIKNQIDKNDIKQSNLKSEETLEELKEKIKKLIKEENYEQAAVIRDKIKNIEGK